jgi:HAD superfamily hydrolase (TIGR01450 family)
MIEKYDSFIFDLDGTIYKGEKLIPKADITINKLKELKKEIIFVSNKTTGSLEDYYNYLICKGIRINKEEIITSSIIIKNHLLNNYPQKKFFAIGERSFIKELSEAGIEYSDNPDLIDIVIITLDRELNYNKLETAAKALERGAKFFAANIDNTCPVEDGEVLDAGSTISALEKRTHKKLEKHFGKPSEFMIDEIRRRLKIKGDKVLLIGDRLETDILMGNLLGVHTALVSTGVTNYLNGNADIHPTYHLNSIYDLIKTKIQ